MRRTSLFSDGSKLRVTPLLPQCIFSTKTSSNNMECPIFSNKPLLFLTSNDPRLPPYDDDIYRLGQINLAFLVMLTIHAGHRNQSFEKKKEETKVTHAVPGNHLLTRVSLCTFSLRMNTIMYLLIRSVGILPTHISRRSVDR